MKLKSRYDAVLIGAGIMSATLATLLHELEPGMRILIIERLSGAGLESSFSLNNAGTGHAANCELNYTPLSTDGTINITKALAINSSFEKSLELWASLTSMGKLTPKNFLNFLPHISFVRGTSDIDFLRRRYEKMSSNNAFSSMEWSIDRQELKEWMPIVLEGRGHSSPIAATRIKRGTDVDFGELTNQYFAALKKSESVEIQFCTEVVDLSRDQNKFWIVELKGSAPINIVQAPFVFIGAGGRALSLLQKSGIPEGLPYAGFPVSGQWLICDEPYLANRHRAKVYGKPKLGAPPMSVPHLDTRWIRGSRSLLFGPFAGFTTKFLKNGSSWDLFSSLTSSNVLPFFQAGLKNLDLVNYLVNQVGLNTDERIELLKEFLPSVREADWKLSYAGQRVQIIKQTNQGGILKMGTEVVSSADGSLTALLGASPGASTAVEIMLNLLYRCWSEKMNTNKWQQKLSMLFPSFGKEVNQDIGLFKKLRKRNDEFLGFNEESFSTLVDR